MEPTPELIRQLRREEVARARRMPFAEKFMAGAELFDYACQISRDGIRMQNPGFTEEEVSQELRRRLSLHERREALR
jgi:Rv0078B-related antitoxin